MISTRPLPLLRQRGFTIAESVAVIVIMGIVGAMVMVFMVVPARSYTDSMARADLADVADNAMRRMARDLRLALPNSVRAQGNYLEFIETRTGLRYLAEDDIGAAGGLPLDWNNAAALTFTVVGGIPTGRHAPVAGNSIVVYNLGETQSPGDAYNCAPRCNRAQIASINTVASTMTLASNPFAAQAAAGEALMSPGKRFHVVTSPVTYGCNLATGRLMRYWNYGFSASQPQPPSAGSSAILAENVTACSFTYTSMANQRSGLVGISLSFQVQDANRRTVTLTHQMHVDNSP